ncbi:MAG: hypothetical protein GXY23_05040 [Myxococcales bacterium]|nr:hypothetical protein [Myxococcales bacterium]
MSTSVTETPFELPKRAEAAQAFERVQPEILALAPERVRRITADFVASVGVVLRAIPRLVSHREGIAETLPKHPIDALDRLKDYAFAAYYAHLLTLPQARPASEKEALVEEGKPLRHALLVAAEALADRGLVSSALVQQIRKGAGHVDLAGDLIALSALFAEAWGEIHDKTAIDVREVERAGELGTALLEELHREPPAPEGLSPQEIRARAYTLLANAYDECRRAIAYLRFHERDADRIAPTMFVRSARKKSGEVEAPSVSEAADVAA